MEKTRINSNLRDSILGTIVQKMLDEYHSIVDNLIYFINHKIYMLWQEKEEELGHVGSGTIELLEAVSDSKSKLVSSSL